MAEEYELWELAAALGIHRIATEGDWRAGEIVAEKEVYWEETREARAEKMADYATQRRERQRERQRERRARQREERVDV